MTRKVRKYHHNPWTISGVTRNKTIETIFENNSPNGHECEDCGTLFEKFKSLEIHKRRVHMKGEFLCPQNCGRRFLSKHAVKKHLLTHMPRKLWPFRCPLCGQMFQGIGDIPKHLKTSYHRYDNIPEVGSKEWKELIYKARVIMPSTDPVTFPVPTSPPFTSPVSSTSSSAPSS